MTSFAKCPHSFFTGNNYNDGLAVKQVKYSVSSLNIMLLIQNANSEVKFQSEKFLLLTLLFCYTILSGAECFSLTQKDCGRRLKYLAGMEVVGPSKRSWAGLVIEFLWCAGEFLLVLIAYFIRNWRYLEIAVSIPSVGLLFYWW